MVGLAVPVPNPVSPSGQARLSLFTQLRRLFNPLPAVTVQAYAKVVIPGG